MPEAKEPHGVRRHRMIIQAAIVCAGTAAVLIVATRVADTKRAPPGLVALMELADHEQGESLIRAASLMSARDRVRAVDRIRAIEFSTEVAIPSASKLSTSSDSNVWYSISAATHMAARRDQQATEALKASLSRAFQTIHSRPNYILIDPVNARWNSTSLPVENHLWALVWIGGIDAHHWVERTIVSRRMGDTNWARDVTSFTRVLTWAADEKHVKTAEWKTPRPNAFDENWPLRFAAAAIDRGHNKDTQDAEKLQTDLAAVIARYREKCRPPDWPTFDEFWLAASASILLAELAPDAQLRRIFPLGMECDVQLMKSVSGTRK